MKKMLLSVGFADMAGFATLPQTLGWERTVGVLNESFRAIGSIIVQHGGHIHKYIGDAMLFSFTDPHQAIRAAEKIGQFRYQVDHGQIRYYVTIATGEVIQLELGHPSLLVNDIMGEPVLRANWLLAQAENSPQGYVLCEETKKYARDEIEPI